MRPTAEMVNQHAADTHEAREAQADGHEAEGHEADGHEAGGHEGGGGALIDRIASKRLGEPDIEFLVSNDFLTIGETEVSAGADIRSPIPVKTSLDIKGALAGIGSVPVAVSRCTSRLPGQCDAPSVGVAFGSSCTS